MPNEIAKLTEEILRNHRMWELPVDPLRIAEEEGIYLEPGEYGEDFDARIEYYSAYKRFCIFYKSAGRSLGRMRFSIAHELGHFYLPEHVKLLVSGYSHDSDSDYHSSDPREKQADEFAAHLLMPMELFRQEVKRFAASVCDLNDLCKLAEKLGTSVASTAFRYCQTNVEPVLGVFSEDGVVQWTCFSEDMKDLGCYFVEWGSEIPEDTQTAKLLDEELDGPIGHRIDPHSWFKWPKTKWLHEEVMRLGDRVLTWFTVDSD